MLSIAASVLAAHPDTQVTLLYGNRRTDTVMFTEELADLKNAYGPRLQLIHALSREPMAAEISSGRLDADRLGRILDALVDVEDVDEWWLCGPLGMTTDARAVLARTRGRGGAGAPGAVLRRRAAARGRPGGAGCGRRDERGDDRPRRPHHHAHPPPGRADPRRRPARARRPAVRVQGRGVRHVPGAGHRRARSTCGATSRWRTTSSPRASSSPARRRPTTDAVTVDYDS